MFDELLAQMNREHEARRINEDSRTLAGLLAALYGDADEPLFVHIAQVPTLDTLHSALQVYGERGYEDAIVAISGEIIRLTEHPSQPIGCLALYGCKAGLWRLH